MANNRDETIRVNYDVTGQDKIKSAQDAMRGVSDAEAVATAAHEKEQVSLDALAEKYAILQRGIELFKELALTVGGLVAFEKIKEEIGSVLETGDKFEKFGIQFTNAFGGVEQGAQAFEKVKTLAESTPLSLDVVTEAALRMRKEGLDPLDGSLQTLIDTNAKYGGSAEQLTGLVDSFAKAMARGELNTRLLVQLQEQGVPAAKLLGDAMGLTADQINKMAKQGELGRSSIALLLNQLASANGGAAASAMGTLTAQVTKLHDQWDEFLELIAKSGVYDFAKEELRQVGEAIQKGLGDGSLQEKAQAISDAIVGIGKAAIGVVSFLTEHAQAVKEVAEAYALLKLGGLAVDITKLGLQAAESAALMVKFGGAGGEAAIAAGSVATNAERAGRSLGVAGEQAKNAATAAAAARSGLLGIVAAISAFDLVKLSEFADLLREDRRASDALAEAHATVNRMLAERKDRLAAAAAATKTAIAADTEHTEVTQKLSDAVLGVVNRLERLRQEGASSVEAVQGAFDKIEIHTPEGLLEIEQKIVNIESASKDAKEAIGSELVGALEKLDAADLSQFQHSVTKALADGKDNAEALSQELQDVLEAELVKVGETAEEAGVKFTKAGQEIITDFRAIAENAQASGRQISEAFDHALSQVKTSSEVEALKIQLKSAFDQGKISATEFARASQEAANALLNIQINASPLEQEMRRIGVASQQSLQITADAAKQVFEDVRAGSDGSAKSIADQQNTFLAYAKAKLAASAQLGAAARAQAEAELAPLAAILGISGAFKDAADNSAASAAAMITDADRAQAAFEREHQALLRLRGGFSGGDGGSVPPLDEAAKNAAAEIQSMGDDGGASLAQLDNALADTRQSLLNISDAAAAAFDARLVGDFAGALDSAGNGALGFSRAIIAMNQAFADTTREIANQRTALTNEIADINKLGTSSQATFGGFGQNVELATKHIDDMIAAIQNGTYNAGLLGQQDLQPLLQALEAAKQRTEEAAQAAEQARQKFNDLAQSIHDELLQAQGDEKALEDERHQKRLDDLKAEAQAANQLNSQAYRQAVDDENALHALKDKNIADSNAKQNQSANTSNKSQSSSGPASDSSGGGSATGGGSLVTSSNQQSVVHNITAHIDLSNAIFVGASKADVENMLLKKIIIPGLRQAQAQSVKPLLGPQR